MDLMPILSTLKRHKTAAGLIVLQLALTCTIVCNGLFLIQQRLERIQEPTGMADDELVLISVTGIGPSSNPEAQTRADLAALRQVPGVQQVTLLNQIPFGGQMTTSALRTRADDKSPAIGVVSYAAGEDGLKTLGLKLVAGRDFEPTEFIERSVLDEDPQTQVPAVIINRHVAQRLFPGEQAIGKLLYGTGGDGASRIVGVVERLSSTHPGAQDEESVYAMLLPVRQNFRSGQYVLRTAPQDRERVLKAGIAALEQSGPGRILRNQGLQSDKRSNYYATDRNMVLLLIGVCLAMMVVTAFGIVGLASFWVQQRTRMIGTRRALGATRGQILRYFQLENLLLSSAGVLLGALGAVALSSLLKQMYELPGLPWFYLPVGALLLALLGQVAVLGPARRAAALPPVAALRS